MKKKIIEEKENMKGQQAAFDKSLPAFQARCAVFFNVTSSGGANNFEVEHVHIPAQGGRFLKNKGIANARIAILYPLGRGD